MSELRSDDIRQLIADTNDSDSDNSELSVGLQNSTSGNNGILTDDSLIVDNNLVDSDHESDVGLNADDIEENSVFDDDSSSDDEPTSSTTADSGWRKWLPHDTRFEEFPYLNTNGFIPPPFFKGESEIDYFSLFFTDELLNQIVAESNRYAKVKIDQLHPLPKRSMWASWTDITLAELKAFFGVIINMGLNPKPDMQDFFSSDWLDAQPFYKDIFTKERFLQIYWNIHLNPPQDRQVLGTLSRSAKVRNVVVYLDKKFREYYCPQSKVSIDESTIGFKGKVVFKVYNKDKPSKWGIKVYVLSDSSNGYVCSMEPYMGTATTNFLVRPDLLVTTRVVLTLIESLQNSYGSVEGLHVFTDRYYSSVELAKILYDKKVHFTGTINRGRKELPGEVKTKKRLKKGEINAFRKDDKINVLQWKDKREVLMISTLYDDSTENVVRTTKGGTQETIKKPSIICRYNENMGGVDLTDHYISSYAFTRKTVKWWRKVFFWLLEVGIVNSFILFNLERVNKGMRKVEQKKFRKSLVRQLVASTRNPKKRGRPAVFDEDQRLNGKLHLIYEVEAGKKKDCAVCSKRTGEGGRKRTKFHCTTCENKPGLHPGFCFEKYHTVKKYK